MLATQVVNLVFLLLGANYVRPEELWPVQASCPKDWSYSNTHCYYISSQITDWNSAHAWCTANMNSELASVNSLEENNYLSKKLLGTNHSSAWLGLHDDGSAFWHWTDGTNMEFTNWMDGEPGNDDNNRNCGQMRNDISSQNGKWSDRPCSEDNVFICKMTVKTCPDLWTYHEEMCYYASSVEASWREARELCKEEVTEADLLSLHSEEENSFFTGMMNHSSWLGLTFDPVSHLWAWSDDSNTTYMNWGEGEPSNDLQTESCAVVTHDQSSTDSNGKWNSVKCSESRAFGCKFAPTHIVGCEDGWVSFGRYCYYSSSDRYSDQIRTYGEARKACQSQGAHLVSIHSAEENDFIFSMVNHYDGTATWIGLTDEDHQGVLSWSDNSTVTYTHWANLGSNAFMNYPACGRFTTFYDLSGIGPWLLDNCDVYMYYICKKVKNSQPIHPAKTGCSERSPRRERVAVLETRRWIPSTRTSPPFVWRFSSPFNSRFSTRLNKEQPQIDTTSLLKTLPPDIPPSFLNYVHHRFRNGYTSGKKAHIAGTNSNRTLESIPISPLPQTPLLGDITIENTPRTQFPLITSNYSISTNGSSSSKSTANKTGGGFAETCELGDEAYQGSCYNLPVVSQSWTGAKAACESRGAHLVVLNDRFETGFVSAFLGELTSRAWIGLSGTEGEDGSLVFSWVDNSTVDFTNWNEFEPNPEHGSCVSVSGEETTLGFWSLRSCDDQMQYVCEYPRDGYTPPPTVQSTEPPPPPTCAQGWSHEGNRCYMVFLDPLSWWEGEQWCQSYGGHLSSIGSADEQDAMHELPGFSEISDVYRSFWVGLQLGSSSRYEWTDGTAIDYLDWAVGQPDSHYGRENCGSADLVTLELSLTVCGAYLPYICEVAEGNMLTTMSPPTKTPDIPCDDDSSWLLYENHCYKFVSASDGDPRTWWESHQRCREEGAELASIHTYEENYWMESKMAKLSDDILWIGGRSTIDSGFTWLDESPFDFINWADGEPNNHYDQEECTGLYAHREGYWNDQNCAHVEGRVCKRPNGVTLPPARPTQVPDGHCPEGWLHAGTKCIRFFIDKKNFTSAREACKDLDRRADLACIHSDLEQAYLTAFVGTLDINVWVGLRNERGYHWVDQSPVTYTNWAAGEPNGDISRPWRYHKNEECVELKASNSPGQWNDIDCSSLEGYVCQTAEDPEIPTHSPPPYCDPPYDDYVSYDGACYRPKATAKTWKDAEADCMEEGAHLASVLSLSEDAMMWVLAHENDFNSTWLGLNDMQDLHLFRWSDGWPALYTGWGPGEPSINSNDQHHCVRIGSADGLWSVERCDEASPFICKVRNGTIPTPDPPVSGHCPDKHWLDLGGSYCYLLSERTRPWRDASMSCLQENANLASIHTEEEMNLITLAAHNIKDPVWIGLVQKRNGFGWSDGSALDFVNWDEGEPNDRTEECAEMYTFNGRWNDASCSFARAYVCKTPKIVQIIPPTGPGTTIAPWPRKALGAGGIAGIFLTVMLAAVAVGFIGYSYFHKKPKLNSESEGYRFDNALYPNGDDSDVRGLEEAYLDFGASDEVDA